MAGPRNPSIDILRGVAVLMVFAYHSDAPLFVFSHLGWAGVDLFFVLSGFLVSRLLFREYRESGTVEPMRFLIRRGFKIYPQFWLLVAVTIPMYALLGPADLTPVRLLAELTFTQSYALGLWPYTWSLAVEEHFYLLLALGVFWAARTDRMRRVPPAIGAICAACLVLRIVNWQARPISDFTHMFPSHLRLDSLSIGVLLGYYWTFDPARLASASRRIGRSAPQVAFVLLSPVALLPHDHPFIVTIGYTTTAIGFAVILLAFLQPGSPAEQGRIARAMAALGRNSYAFYLWHGPILFLFYRASLAFGALPLAVDLALKAACCIAAATLSTKLVEKPFLDFRDRFSGGVRTGDLARKVVS